MAIQELVRQTTILAAARRALEASAATVRAARVQFETDNAALLEQLKADQQAVVLEEEVTRKLASIYYATTLEKKLSPGVEIAVGTEYTIDVDAGLKWALEKQMCLIPAQLDVGAVKKIASVSTLPFVTTSPKVTVRIATDLDKALAVAGSEVAVK
jgi:hypothetical protein